MSTTTYELLAIKYAELDRPAPENFVFRDVHDGAVESDDFWLHAASFALYNLRKWHLLLHREKSGLWPLATCFVARRCIS